MRAAIKFLLIFVFLIFSNIHTNAQVLNVESLRIRSDTTGWFGDVGLSAAYINSENTVVQAQGKAQVQLKQKRDLFLFLANYNILKGDGAALVDDYMFHLRYNVKINKWIRWEAFGQFQSNEIVNIERRILIGTGPRFKLADNKSIRIYLGTLAMREFEQESGTERIYHDDYRVSSYLSFNVKLAETVEFVSTTYYQPKITGFEDYRILNQSTLHIAAGKHFVFNCNYQYIFDARPAVGIINHTSNASTGLAYRF